MTTMTEDEYISQRLDDQITWYSGKAAHCQHRYKTLRLIEITAAALIPLLSGMSEQVPHGPWLIGALGATIAICSAAGALFKYHENWIQYRVTAEKLKQERFLFLTGSQPYDDAARFSLLVQRVEATVSSEATVWAQVTKQTTRAAPEA